MSDLTVGRIEQLTSTRGPWRVVDRPSRGIQIEWGGPDDNEERPVAHLRWTDGLRADVNARVLADAHLIAAAPELKNALSDCLDVIEPIRDELRKQGKDDAAAVCDEVVAYARAVLAKAEGRS